MNTVSNALIEFDPADNEPGTQSVSDPAFAPDIVGPGGGHAESGHTADLTRRVEKLTDDLSTLATQNQKLLKSVSHLLDLYEAEKAQRLALQTSLDRVVEDMAGIDPALEPQVLAEEIRNGVSNDLKPLLHAILDVLEISMRRSPSNLSGPTPAESLPANDPSDRQDEPTTGVTDDLPRTLPEILTKPVEELVAPSQSRRSGKPQAGDSVAGTGDVNRESTTAKPTGRRSVLSGHTRPGAWIPVTSDKTKR